MKFVNSIIESFFNLVIVILLPFAYMLTGIFVFLDMLAIIVAELIKFLFKRRK